ncbi:MAG: hypothetical protein NC133_03830 [Prevotella sp.]|nr:hypothetical protein [Prevotella sp.]
METTTETMVEPKFNLEIPYNHPVLVAERKRNKISVSVILLIVAAAFVILGFCSYGAQNSSDWVLYIFLGFAGVSALVAVWMLLTTKPNPKHNDRMIKMVFFEDYLKVTQDNGMVGGKVKNLENCLYRKYANKQYVRYVFEYHDRIMLRILTGTYNGAPTYSNHSIPKAIFAAGEADNFKTFLQDKVGKDYKVKTK